MNLSVHFVSNNVIGQPKLRPFRRVIYWQLIKLHIIAPSLTMLRVVSMYLFIASTSCLKFRLDKIFDANNTIKALHT